MVNPKSAPKPRRVGAAGAGAKREHVSIGQWLEKLSFSSNKQQAFLEDLATLIEDGVTASRAIDVISHIEEGPKKKVAQSIAKRLSEGRSVADGMVGWFNASTVELVRAGEQGGTLAGNIRAAATSLSSKSGSLSALANSIIYPLIVICMGCGVLIYLNYSIFPQFASIKPIEEWPEVGRSLVDFANFVQLWWWLIIVIIIGVIVGLVYVLHNFVGKSRALLDSIYGLSVYRELESARFMETLGLLIANGIVFKNALKIVEHQASPYLGWHLKLMQIRLGKGSSNIADVLDTGLITDAHILRLKAIAEAKGFEHALMRLGRQASVHATETVRRLGRILGVVLLLVGASLSVFMVMGIYSVGSSLTT